MQTAVLLAVATLVTGAAIQGNTPLPAIKLDKIQKLSFSHPVNASEPRKRQISEGLGGDFADPSIIGFNGGWAAYSTSHGTEENVPVAWSSDFSSWELRADAMPTIPVWVDQSNPQIWSPDVNEENGRFFMYFAAQLPGQPTPRRAGLSPAPCHCIGVAFSNSGPFGPFIDSGAPIICPCDQGGAIDPAGYDDGVNRWITYKIDGNNRGGASSCGPHANTGYAPTPIVMQQVSRDGFRLQGAPSVVLNNLGRANDGVVEAPSLYKIQENLSVLFYSSHCYSSDDYDIEYAFASVITGSYVDRGKLLFHPAGGLYGPGGLDIDKDGKHVVFHGRTTPNDPSGPRSLFTAELTIDGEDIHFGALR